MDRKKLVLRSVKCLLQQLPLYPPIKALNLSPASCVLSCTNYRTAHMMLIVQTPLSELYLTQVHIECRSEISLSIITSGRMFNGLRTGTTCDASTQPQEYK